MSLTSLVSKAMDAFTGSPLGGLLGRSNEPSQIGVSYIKDIEWGYQALFTINAMYMANCDGKVSSNAMHLFSDTTSLNSFINASILNIETATITHSPIEEWIGGDWVYTTGRPELRQITFTFRETASAWLYRNFNTAYNANKNSYPDNQKWTINVSIHGATPSSGDVSGEGLFGIGNSTPKNKGTLISTSKAMLDSIGAISLDQSSVDGFVTFSVTFKYMNETHNFDTNLKVSSEQAIKNPT